MEARVPKDVDETDWGGVTVRKPRYADKIDLPESRTLAERRDALLPKLISDDRRVPDAEALVGMIQ